MPLSDYISQVRLAMGNLVCHQFVSSVARHVGELSHDVSEIQHNHAIAWAEHKRVLNEHTRMTSCIESATVENAELHERLSAKQVLGAAV